MIRAEFVPVAVSGHVAMNRKDADGDFLRKTGIKLAGAGGNVECLTASGTRLGSFYPAGGIKTNKAEADAILKKFAALPESERKAGAVTVPNAGEVADNVKAIQPPKGALILRTYHRVLTREKDGTVRKVAVTDYPKEGKLSDTDTWQTHFGERWEAQPDFMWIQETEWKALVKDTPTKGDSYPLPPAVADRMTRAHLIAGMAYGECGLCGKKDVRESKLTLTVTGVTADAVTLRLDGAVALGADFATSQAKDKKGAEKGEAVQGFEPKVLGHLTYDRKKEAFTRFDVVALGDAYGTPSGAYHFYYRPGKYPIGIAMELAADKPAERIPPRASVVYDTPNPEYLKTGK